MSQNSGVSLASGSGDEQDAQVGVIRGAGVREGDQPVVMTSVVHTHNPVLPHLHYIHTPLYCHICMYVLQEGLSLGRMLAARRPGVLAGTKLPGLSGGYGGSMGLGMGAGRSGGNGNGNGKGGKGGRTKGRAYK
jgi:hypothetical protein